MIFSFFFFRWLCCCCHGCGGSSLQQRHRLQFGALAASFLFPFPSSQSRETSAHAQDGTVKGLVPQLGLGGICGSGPTVYDI